MFVDGMECWLCGKLMTGTDRLFGTWGIWLPSSDRLHDYCDATFHWDCYANWKYRRRFAQSYFKSWVDRVGTNPHWLPVYRDDSILVEVSASPIVASTWVSLAETGSRLSIELDRWDLWLASIEQEDLHPVEHEAVIKAKVILYRYLPSREAVICRTGLASTKPEQAGPPSHTPEPIGVNSNNETGMHRGDVCSSRQ